MTSVTQQARFPVLYDFDQDQALTKNTSKVGPIIQQPLQPRDNFPKGLRGGGPCFDCLVCLCCCCAIEEIACFECCKNC
ncbi:unnamed protein product [Rotaria magnacalcarata]|uniref:Cysteine-rich transmembrane CYSTM domain-containing protein n=1 Tax=Rotaria magnacalcarata TaxID=392030 RepID=A0A815T223_9BILA|nr:unnamed protein product [Rotaria magnacalcarata]CAF1497268.1 unnamed protein product [Rotaria magnacalcarata]CAF2033250.1 unnamed protein product [Rotaria magnacalcarata]CAF2050312.1 unnamed protein product [Rotaria magnacalcarata]